MNNLLHPTSTKYRGLRPKSWASIVLLALFAAIIAAVGFQTRQYEKALDRLGQAIQLQAHAAVKHYPVDSTSSEQQQIIAYVEEVFGPDAPKAFKLLGCENARLNPSASNTAGNTPAGSRDLGVFQINEHWQRTQGKFLLNWKVNVQIAKQLFDENGGSFKLWTCGRKLGI